MINPSDIQVNYVAVLVAALASMVIGYVWYGPLFGKMWTELTNKKDMSGQGSMGMTYGITYVLAAITAYVLAHFVQLAGATDWVSGASTGFWAWLGFVVTVIFTNGLFEARPHKLSAIYAGYQLVNLVVMGIILACWTTSGLY